MAALRNLVLLRMVCWQARVILYLLGLAFACEILRQVAAP